MPSLKPSLAAADRAFPSHPRLDCYFAARATESARVRIAQCVLRGDGPAMLLGAPGVGKTMLLEVLAADLERHLRVVRLAGAQLCTRRALLQAILHGLGGPYRNREEGELRIDLGELATDPSETGIGFALLVDEAQALPIRLLEELRQLANLSSSGSPRVRLVLAGSHALDEAFTAPELEAFNQRLAARCYLEPLSHEETSQYVRAHIAAAGGDPDAVLMPDAYEAIRLASDGLPRLINQVVDRALTLATEKGAVALDHAAISEAWSDLHQLAAPWQSPAKAPLAAASSPSVEYGLLDEDHASQEEFDLQAEAAAVMALGEQVGVESGDWVAGDKLENVSMHDREELAAESDDELVSYAFPIVGDDESPEGESLAEQGDPVVAEDVVPEEAEPEANAEVNADPFSEAFEEEELLLDPNAGRERVIPTAPVVTALTSTDLNEALTAYTESLSPAVAPAGVEITTPEKSLQPVESTDPQGDAILVIEEDDSDRTKAPPVHRQDYAELFANLRQG